MGNFHSTVFVICHMSISHVESSPVKVSNDETNEMSALVHKLES